MSPSVTFDHDLVSNQIGSHASVAASIASGCSAGCQTGEMTAINCDPESLPALSASDPRGPTIVGMWSNSDAVRLTPMLC